VKFAAIDIGTNAVRLLLSKVIEDEKPAFFKKEALMRMPLRLGEDAFTQGRISQEKIDLLAETMVGFKHLIRAYPARDYMAVATSAMREAENGLEVAKVVEERSGVKFDIIDGQREAEVIYANHIEKRLDPKMNYLYVDVGGGSTEIIILARGNAAASQSFQLGTVRMLQERVDEETWKDLKKWLKTNTEQYQPMAGIGSGGNINKIFKLAHIKNGKPISFKNIKNISNYLSSFTLEQRITKLGLRPDRADVIIPAIKIYMSVMKWAKMKWMYVPQFGLSDGIVHVLYKRHREQGAIASGS
jgi:exopolyphosphatase/guanosine-5'-triphosphate,3'-diphosphate pyrophosphatase